MAPLPFSSYSGSETHIRIDHSVTSIPKHAFEGNKKLVEVELPDSIRHIGIAAFCGCSSLKRIHLSEGLQTIGRGAFALCKSLLRVAIPSTVTDIGAYAFSGCISLKEARMHEGLHTIGEEAFRKCITLTRVTIPSTVTDFGRLAFYGCSSLKDAHLCEGLCDIGVEAFTRCDSLMRINIPSNVVVNQNHFRQCYLLRNVFISPLSSLRDTSFLFKEECPIEMHRRFRFDDLTIEMLKQRFDDLPLHELCYYHSHKPMESINRWTSIDFSKVDCLGMTPLHVLACSGMHDLSLYRRIYEMCPNAYVVEDRWGELPLAYIILSEAPKEVLHFFFEMHRRNEGTIPLDFSEMIERLAKFSSGEYMRRVIQAQRTYFPDLEVEWDIIGEEILSDFRYRSQIDDDGPEIRLGAVCVLIEASVSRRSVCMIPEHQIKIEKAIVRMSYDEYDHEYEDIQQMVIEYATLYHNKLVDATTILELALWKMLLNEVLQLNQNIIITDDRSVREQIRSDSGNVFNVVISNVLPFL